ncbi:DUF3352 domain-containing protein [Haloactinospora alba]|nr:DUF3352 domain-containing protein [Haloactinospora alba]
MGGAPYPQQPPQGKPRKKRIWMIPVAAGVGVALMATTVWASSSVFSDLFGGPQPESALPSSSIAFTKLDLKPSGNQLADYASFVEKLPKELRDEIDPEADPAKEIIEDEYDYLDYEEDVEPWLGQRFGMSVWEPDNDSADQGEGFATVVAIAIEDQDAAEEALSEVKDNEDDVYYDVREDFALLAPNEATFSDLDDQVESDGTLEENSAFSEDMGNVGDNSVAAAWADLEGISGLMEDSGGSMDYSDEYGYDDDYGSGYEEDPLPDPTESLDELKGRMAVGVTINSDSLELRGDVTNLSVNGSSPSDYPTPEPGLDSLGKLPDDTVLAVGGNGLDEFAKKAWEENSDSIDDVDAIERGFDEEFGEPLPDAFSSILGSKTALGFTDLGGALTGPGSGGMPSFQLRAVGADSDLLEKVVEVMEEDSYGSAPGVNEDGDAVVVSSGTTSSGKLADDPLYERAMGGMDDAGIGAYMDLEQPMKEAGESSPEEFGALGAGVGYDEDKVSLTMRWAPNGG